MRGGNTLLDPADVQNCVFQVRLLPPKVHQLGGPQTVPEGQQTMVESRWFLLPRRLAQRRVDALLPAGAAFLEIFEHVSVEAERHRFFHARQ